MFLEFTCLFATQKVRLTASPTDATGAPTSLKGPMAVTLDSGSGSAVLVSNEVVDLTSGVSGDASFTVSYPSDSLVGPDQILIHFAPSGSGEAVNSNLVGEVLPK